MHKFWYHSPVRFYPDPQDLEDMTNPQNTQYFGEFAPFPLELNDFHRFLIPNIDNETTETELFVYCVNQTEAYKLVSVCEIADGKLKYVTFKSKKPITGNLEIRNSGGTVLFTSNCVEFTDSTLPDGRKFIRIATKHHYNRNLFDYGDDLNWMICSVPAYCLGMHTVEVETSNSRTGGNNTLRPRETYIDEVTEYEFTAKGDANILNFLQVHVTNNHFYIDGTKRTAIEKMDREEFAMFGKLRFASTKYGNGLNVLLDYETVLQNIFIWVLGDETKTVIYTDNDYNVIPVQ